jgi:hypothetical protein
MSKKIISFIGTLILVISILIGCKNNASTSTDAISSASTKYYYESNSLEGEELIECLKSKDGAITMSTVNADGSPNCAVIIPSVVDDNILKFRLVNNQTKENILKRKLAVLTTYIYKPESEDKSEKNSGARIVLEYIEDNKEINKLMKQTNSDTGTVFMKIIKILPLG